MPKRKIVPEYPSDPWWIVVPLLVIVLVVVPLLVSWFLATGPGCPGDPDWLGKCSEVRCPK